MMQGYFYLKLLLLETNKLKQLNDITRDGRELKQGGAYEKLSG
jgi:hypothetical protein